MENTRKDQNNIFRSTCVLSAAKVRTISYGRNTSNIISRTAEWLQLKVPLHPHPYHIQWLLEGDEMQNGHQCKFVFLVGSKYWENVRCNPIPMKGNPSPSWVTMALLQGHSSSHTKGSIYCKHFLLETLAIFFKCGIKNPFMYVNMDVDQSMTLSKLQSNSFPTQKEWSSPKLGPMNHMESTSEPVGSCGMYRM